MIDQGGMLFSATAIALSGIALTSTAYSQDEDNDAYMSLNAGYTPAIGTSIAYYPPGLEAVRQPKSVLDRIQHLDNKGTRAMNGFFVGYFVR